MNQTERKAMLTQQNDKCAICATTQPTPKGLCYQPDQNVLICRRCNAFLHNYKAAIKYGITPDTLEGFLNREPAPEPTPMAKAEKTRPPSPDSHAKLVAACKLAETTIERLNRHGSANGTLDVIQAALTTAGE